MNKLTAELLHQLKSAAQEEIMCREASDTSDAWQDLASPENVLALLEIALPVLERQEKEVYWGAPKSIAQLISQLQTFEPETEITALMRIENYQDGKQIRQVPLSISWERMEGPWLAPFKGDGRKVIAFWAKPDIREEGERGGLITDESQQPSTTPQIENDGREG